MNKEEFQAFKERLAARTAEHPDLIGLVFLGSASDSSRQDRWSDHDFFLISKEGLQQHFREDLSWLPEGFNIELGFQDTDHGVQVISDTGHLLEFAVFSEDELYRYARVNAYSLMVDKGNLAEILRHCAREQVPQEKDLRHHVGKVLTCSIISMGRYARGERASGREVFLNGVLRSFIYMYKNLPIVEGQPKHHRMDNLDVFRRIETTHPDLGKLLDEFEGMPVPRALQRVLEIQLQRCGHLPWYPKAAHLAVQDRLQDALKIYI
ncbi:hypothetical protein [Deinococcus cellulosilyticus]|uniref:Nucleotidyltransferase domain-containing protein n=1 Tax=Deinococcus cellulosilyticus (strain DSM 18568 / NBRC 106333 / KACC 11606 / 5516J-15) TaxID=1223518 RepID=A0A511N142_DEIC1|nr:hypothetical protein [Deinococcus cellulosilyticus]GEM46585.1 hypothetical protein DC3_22200 [Deinococcus cellulosilyticus NBRC 106333 = KACC 11606]